jgi:hypothetical protein
MNRKLLDGADPSGGAGDLRRSEKLSLVRLFERLFRRKAQQPVLVSATPQTEVVARMVNG